MKNRTHVPQNFFRGEVKIYCNQNVHAVFNIFGEKKNFLREFI